jgi:ComF family protein
VIWVRVDQVLDTLFPPRCLLCGQPAAGALVPACAGCLADLPWVSPVSSGPPVLGSFGSVLSALKYEYPVDRLIAAAKFGRQVPVARRLGELLALRMPALPDPPDAVVPVPLHWRREATRGFNQAEEIARALCHTRGWPMRADLCRRVRPTPEQSGLGAALRRDNLRGAFALSDVRAARACRHVLLVDDVLTTGATAAAVGNVFQAVGVRQLSLWTVALAPAPWSETLLTDAPHTAAADQFTERKV